MNPNRTMWIINEHVGVDGDEREARRYMGILADWIDEGGYDPDWDIYPAATKAFRDFRYGLDR